MRWRLQVYARTCCLQTCACSSTATQAVPLTSVGWHDSMQSFGWVDAFHVKLTLKLSKSNASAAAMYMTFLPFVFLSSGTKTFGWNPVSMSPELSQHPILC